MTLLPSIYEDDYVALMAGKNPKYLCYNVQKHVDEIINWTGTWGFKLNHEKAWRWSSSPTRSSMLQSISLSRESSSASCFKFLGVTFNRRHSWEPHISNVVERTRKACNLMQSVSGESWGAGK